MSVEVPVLEVLALADRLRAAAVRGAGAVARLGALDDAGGAGGVGVALEAFLGCFALAARAVAEETDLLGDAAAAAARSWVALDAALLAGRGRLAPP